MRCRRSAVVIAASLLLASPLCSAEDVIHVAYSERPPYMMAQDDGTPTGLTGAPAAAAFKAAGIPVQWHKVPTNRQLFMVKDHGSPSCAIGWFAVPERQQFAKFTKAIYRDRSWVALTHAAFAARGISSLEELSRQRDIRVLIKDNYSYGGLDNFMKQWQPVVAVSTASTLKMVQSVSKGMVDLMFVSEDEGNYIIKHLSDQAANLRLMQFKDMPRGLERHIMCGTNVPDEVIARLNKAITFK
jgi:ABC-type amino acid transport substrate-binding protein